MEAMLFWVAIADFEKIRFHDQYIHAQSIVNESFGRATHAQNISEAREKEP